MKNFEERRAEIFRRSEERIEKRKKTRLCCVSVFVCTCIALLLVVILPAMDFSKNDTLTIDTNTAGNNTPSPSANEIINNRPVVNIPGSNISGFSGYAGLRVIDENGDMYYKWDVAPQNLNEGINLLINTSISFDTTAKFRNMAADIYVFCDGHIIKHAESIDDEPVEVTRHSITHSNPIYEENENSKIMIDNENIENLVNIYIPPTSIGDVDETLLWVCINYIPEYVPLNSMGEMDNMLMDYIPVYSSGKDSGASVYEAQEKDYINGKKPTDSYGHSFDRSLDIGVFKEDTYSVLFPGIYGTAEVKNDTDFCIVANYVHDSDYYLAVFCNGELMDMFEGNTFMKANFNGGERMIKYSIDKSVLPENGTYSYQVIALPSKDRGNFTHAFNSSDKRKVIISLDE